MRNRLSITTALVLAAGAMSAVYAEAAPHGSRATATLTVRSSDFGRIIFDGRGRALYAFTRDRRGPSACYGACATAWPPYYARGRLRAGAGIKRSLIGTTRRRDGRRQVTHAGRPLYYYVDDRAPGVVRCQNVFEFSGLWLVIRANGRIVR